MKSTDRRLGMDRDISRRDFLNGVGVAIGGSLLSPRAVPDAAASQSTGPEASAQMMPGYYPPVRDGMRGSHPGSFEVAHLMRDGKRFSDSADSTETGEDYDLVVVGGGISGLAAARFYQKERGPDSRILIIENYDDFGGHAKRNEFRLGGRTLVDLGGAEYLEAPWSYPEAAKALLDDLGVDVALARDVFDSAVYDSLNLRGGIFFDKETFGADRLVAGASGLAHGEQQTAYVTLPAELEVAVGERDAVSSFLDKTPLSSSARAEVLELFCGDVDYLEGKSKQERLALLSSISYEDFLKNIVGASPDVVQLFWMWRGSYIGNGADLTPAVAAFRYGFPGGTGLGIADDIRRSAEWSKHSYKRGFSLSRW